MTNDRYHCVKCGNDDYETGEIRTTGGFWSKIFDIQNRRFYSVSCTDCGYTEFYNGSSGRTAENIFDFLTT